MRCLLIALLALSGAVHAASNSLTLKWTELAGTVQGGRVIVNLKDGSQVKGVVGSVEQNALAVNISSDSNATYKKGQASIPRDRIAGLRLIRMHVRGRVIGTTVGALVGIGGGGAIVLLASDPLGGLFGGPTHPNRGGEAAGISLMAGLPVAGYFIGRAADHQEIVIVIAPDATSSP